MPGSSRKHLLRRKRGVLLVIERSSQPTLVDLLRPIYLRRLYHRVSVHCFCNRRRDLPSFDFALRDARGPSVVRAKSLFRKRLRLPHCFSDFGPCVHRSISKGADVISRLRCTSARRLLFPKSLKTNEQQSIGRIQQGCSLATLLCGLKRLRIRSRGFTDDNAIEGVVCNRR